MENIVNYESLQTILEDCLFSVRYINTDHHNTLLTPEDFSSLELKLAELINSVKAIFNSEGNIKDNFPNLYEANHIKQTRDKIFIKAVNVFLHYCNREHKTFDESHLEAAYTIATDSIEKLYQVKL